MCRTKLSVKNTKSTMYLESPSPPRSQSLSVGFIGAGMMASSLVDGLVSKKVVDSPKAISCSDVVSLSLVLVRTRLLLT